MKADLRKALQLPNDSRDLLRKHLETILPKLPQYDSSTVAITKAVKGTIGAAEMEVIGNALNFLLELPNSHFLCSELTDALGSHTTTVGGSQGHRRSLSWVCT